MKNIIWTITMMFILSSLMAFCNSVEEPPSAQEEPDSLFSGPQMAGKIANNALDEISGLAVSRANPDLIWAHNDSGDQPRIFLFDKKGVHKGVYNLKDVPFQDVEDMAIGPGPQDGVDYIYLADIGDNMTTRGVKYIYRFPEPDVSDLSGTVEAEINQVDVIKLKYPDQRRDAETFMIDPLANEMIIISKREPEVHVYKASIPNAVQDTITFENIGKLSYPLAVAGDISANGQEILIKTYESVNYYQLESGESFVDILKKKPKKLAYEREPQGEAIAWDPDASGYYTASEEIAIFEAILYYYQRY